MKKKFLSLTALFAAASISWDVAHAQQVQTPQPIIPAPAHPLLTTREAIINHAIDEFEGTRYTKKKNDKGGATKYGITKDTLAVARKHPVSTSDVKKLTRKEALSIYTARFWDKNKIGDLPPSLRCVVFDMSINHGLQ